MSGRPEPPFDPLDYANIAKSVVDALLAQPLVALGAVSQFDGAGIYAMYYSGPFPAYSAIARPQGAAPIYVGKAIPPGGRKGVKAVSLPRTQALWKRLVEHAISVQAAGSLSLPDFTCRYVVVETVWIPLAEQVLVDRFRPVWNVVIDGFGNHPPGRGRHAMRRPRWDIVHPGRPWAAELRAEETTDEILREVAAHFAPKQHL